MPKLETFTDSSYLNDGLVDFKALNNSGRILTDKIKTWADIKLKEAIRNKGVFSYKIINATQTVIGNTLITTAFVAYEG